MSRTSSLPWLSSLLLLLANGAFGLFLHEHYPSDLAWIAAVVYITLMCSVLSVAWRPVRNLVLLGFQSDVGYSLMALAIASFAVVIAVWIHISSYFLMMWAAALLLRVDLLTWRVGSLLSFAVMLLISWMGLALSWVPSWL